MLNCVLRIDDVSSVPAAIETGDKSQTANSICLAVKKLIGDERPRKLLICDPMTPTESIKNLLKSLLLLDLSNLEYFEIENECSSFD